MTTPNDGKKGLNKLYIPCETDEISDGYHTFGELYEHRMMLFVALMITHPDISWRSKKNSDGTSWDGWFIAGMELDSGQISYHLTNDKWDLLYKIKTFEIGPWDGHDANDVLKRLKNWITPADYCEGEENE